MPREYYASPDVFAREREQVFTRNWICVGRSRDFAEPGSYRLADIAGESLIVVRDRAGEIRAHYNVCRHRGTRLCTVSVGHVFGNDPVPVPRVDVPARRPVDRRAAHDGDAGLLDRRLSAPFGGRRAVGRFRLREPFGES